MRCFLALLLLLAIALPAMAQDAPVKQDAPIKQDAPAKQDVPALAQATAKKDATAKQPRLTWEAHFAQANTAHDGHLTLEEAKTGFKTVARHYRDIDVDGKGYVTENDVRAWRAMPKPARHASEPDDPLRPRPAFQNAGPPQRTLQKASTHAVVRTPEASR